MKGRDKVDVLVGHYDVFTSRLLTRQLQRGWAVHTAVSQASAVSSRTMEQEKGWPLLDSNKTAILQSCIFNGRFIRAFIPVGSCRDCHEEKDFRRFTPGAFQGDPKLTGERRLFQHRRWKVE